MSAGVLLVDADPAVGRHLRAVLEAEVLDVTVVADVPAALASAARRVPDLVVVDDEVPPDGGLALLRLLRSAPSTAAVPVVLLSAAGGAADRSVALASGADDHLAKPFDTFELVARLRATLRRTADARAASPLTGLPGNARIDREVAERAARGRPYAVCHVDLDEFKSFNDAYGFQRGDGLLLLAASRLQLAAATAGAPAPFVGHVGGDDFVVVCTPEQAEPLCARAAAAFDDAVAALYDPAHAAAGGLEAVDRRGVLRRHPLVSVSIGVALADGSPRDHRAVVAAAGEMKTVAKGTPGSTVAVDRRG